MQSSIRVMDWLMTIANVAVMTFTPLLLMKYTPLPPWACLLLGVPGGIALFWLTLFTVLHHWPRSPRSNLMGEPCIPREVESEVGDLIAALRAAGWSTTAAVYDEQVFGNWCVDLVRGKLAIRLVKDRSQYMIDGPRQLKAAGLAKNFDHLDEFRRAVLNWAASLPPT